MSRIIPNAMPELTGNGNSAFNVSTGRPIVIMASGTFGSGTLKLQISPDEGSTWFDTGQSLTAKGIMTYAAPEGVEVRLNLSGSTSPSIFAWEGFTHP